MTDCAAVQIYISTNVYEKNRESIEEILKLEGMGIGAHGTKEWTESIGDCLDQCTYFECDEVSNGGDEWSDDLAAAGIPFLMYWSEGDNFRSGVRVWVPNHNACWAFTTPDKFICVQLDEKTRMPNTYDQVLADSVIDLRQTFFDLCLLEALHA